ncbi:hypothetical protein [Tianweitania sediminis]|uniref:Uncharacterized protein n=1 Tax=Tianweitania sediminis TaxID=1502156 RepID=A0A8J7R1B7_9HYPH|nr:hypothetical protein [Tianweitania sediminis]MBP0438406.1 hypothetical protein [Tianweitania sediminis]
MGNYSKLIGSVVGAAFGAAVAFGLLPNELATPEIQGSVIALITAVCVYFFPANQPSV